MGDTGDISASEQVARLLARVESLSRDNERLAADNAALARAAAEAARVPADLERRLREELAAVGAERDRLVETVLLANRRFFGCRSEKVAPNRLSPFDDMGAAAGPGAAEPEAGPAKPRRRGGKRRVDFSKPGQLVVRRELPGPDRRRPECGHPLEEFKVEVTYALRMVPARLVAERRERAACRCPGCRGADAAGEGVPAPIVRAPAPAAPAKGSFAAPSLIACVPNGKCASALPPCRTGCDSKCLGAPTSGQDMADWTVRAWEL